MKLFFVLGREPALSIAEVFSVLERELGREARDHIARGATLSPEILLAEVPDTLDARALMSMLGGTIKIGHVLHAIPVHAAQAALVEKIVNAVHHTPSYTARDRIHFGISPYLTDSAGRPTLRMIEMHMKKLGMETKRLLKEEGKSSRWVTSRAPSLSSVVVETNKLLKEGTEVVLLCGREHIMIGHTVVVQPFRDLERRDFPRPGRDAKSGMLPPKLARTMMNLTAALRDETLLDPFCGSGTVLGEALLLGYTKLVGSDIDPIAVQNTNRNLDWLTKNGLVPKTDHAHNVKLFESDIRDLKSHIEQNSIGAIATETYLGPPLKGNESRGQLETIRNELTPLFRDTLRVFATLLKPNGRAVIAFPLIRYKKEVLATPVLDELTSFGLQFVAPLSMQVPPSLHTEFGRDDHTLIYGRPDQRVWREIAIMQKI